jgi:hypothetical protein
MIANFFISHGALNSLMTSKIQPMIFKRPLKKFATTQIYKLHLAPVYNQIHNLTRA